MGSGAAATLPDAGESAPPRRYQRACLVLVACWALPGVALCAVVVNLSLTPVSTLDVSPIPDWLYWINLLVFLSQPLAVLAMVPLLPGGFGYLRRAAAGWRRLAAWASVAAIALALEVTLAAAVVNALRPVSYIRLLRD